ncbi:MAG: hypothetical protein GXY54_08890 [Deltaproteobacteria bacterium]|nr:hypothetical protein [Deltaproteobacteria bacterium]
MGIFDYFKPVSTWSADRVRQFLQKRRAGEYQLLDVRQRKEYDRGHLPGALLVPLDHLQEEMKKLDSDKTTITYCGIGVRSRAAAATLKNAGFTDVHSMAGGIKAWEGHSAVDEPEAGAVYFSPANTLDEFIGLAWLIERATRTFYLAMAERFTETGSPSFFQQMAATEERHQTFLEDLFEKTAGEALDEESIRTRIPSLPDQAILEGGVSLADALRWADRHTPAEIVQLAIAFETNAWDRYLLMAHGHGDGEIGELFRTLAEEEKNHLQQLGDYLNQL